MNEILKVYLSLSVSGALLILILFFCKFLCQNRMSRQWQYYIWLVVILRLLLPLAPQTNLVGSLLQMSAPAFFQTERVQLPELFRSALPEDGPVVTGTQGVEAASAAQSMPELTAFLTDSIWLIWLAVALVLFWRKISIYQGFVRFAKAGQTVVPDVRHLDMLAVISAELHITKAVDLYINPQVSSPLFLGFFRPCIILPHADLSDKEFRYTVLHELTHYRRGDMFYKWLVQFTVCLHWFNPLVYLMGREINQACEFSCDESIIARLDADSARAYGATLLHAMTIVGKPREASASITLSTNKELLKERLGAIVYYQKKSKAVIVITMFLSLAIGCGATYMGAYAADDHKISAFSVPQAALSTDQNNLTKGIYKMAAKTKGSVSRTDSLIQSFAPYEPYGVIYDPEQDIVSYQGKRVKLFVAFQAEKEGFVKNAFDLCYQDGNTDSKLYLRAVRDAEGHVIGIKELEDDLANDLVATTANAGPSDKKQPDMEEEIAEALAEIADNTYLEEQAYAETSQGKQERQYFTMDATQIIKSAGITARDVAKEQAGQTIKDWIVQCDQQQGVYLKQVPTLHGYTTYVYYNGGGRYPWNMYLDGNRVNIQMYSDSSLATTDGYYFMYFTAPQKYTDIHLYLDDLELPLS